MVKKVDYLDLNMVNSKEDFVKFILALKKDYQHNPDYYNNNTVQDLLQAIADFVTSGIEGHHKFFEIEFDVNKPTWNMFARIISCASVY